LIRDKGIPAIIEPGQSTRVPYDSDARVGVAYIVWIFCSNPSRPRESMVLMESNASSRWLATPFVLQLLDPRYSSSSGKPGKHCRTRSSKQVLRVVTAVAETNRIRLWMSW